MVVHPHERFEEEQAVGRSLFVAIAGLVMKSCFAVVRDIRCMAEALDRSNLRCIEGICRLDNHRIDSQQIDDRRTERCSQVVDCCKFEICKVDRCRLENRRQVAVDMWSHCFVL